MEEIKKIEVQGQQYGVADMLMRSVMGGNAQVIEWSHTHNMNDYKDAGTYRIKGERTGNPLEDNLPIMNQGSGHTIDGILYVLDSSLTNGSGNSDDCTVTQFLMLSNRVGGKEGDMYMRSAYGANKQSLTWKHWEKYQTNVEVGVVKDEDTLNPSNPTQILKYGYGMNSLIDNGIYSGVYIPHRIIAGEFPGGLEIADPSGIETFVMVVINNYAAAGDARCITQIKFAVTNGGVFSMEKRTSNEVVEGMTYYSQWESVGGGNFLINEPNTSNSSSLVIDGSTLNLKFSTWGGDWDITAKKESLEFNNNKKALQCIISEGGLTIGSDAAGPGGIAIGNNVKIGEGVNITNNEIIVPKNKYCINFSSLSAEWNTDTKVEFNHHCMRGTSYRLAPNELGDSQYYIGIAIPESGEGFKTGGREYWDVDENIFVNNIYEMLLTKDNIRFRYHEGYEEVDTFTQLPYGLTIEPSEDGSKLLISYNGKTAELQLT